MTRTKPEHRRKARSRPGARKTGRSRSGPREPKGPREPDGPREPGGPPDKPVFIRSEEERYARADDRYPFGPSFFRRHLRAFLRDEAAEPTDVLPVVEIHLVDRHPLDLAHIISITPEWVALAVTDRGEGSSTRLRTEFVPYDAIARVTLLPVRTYASQLGFDRARLSRIMNPPPQPAMTPAAAIRSAAGDTEAPAVPDVPSEQEPPAVPEAVEQVSTPATASDKQAHRTGRRGIRLTRRPRPTTPGRA